MQELVCALCGAEALHDYNVCSSCEIAILNKSIDRLKTLRRDLEENGHQRDAAWLGISEAAREGLVDKERLHSLELMMRAGLGLCPLCANSVVLMTDAAPFDTGLPTYEYYWRCQHCEKDSRRYVLKYWDESALTKDFLRMDFLVHLVNERLSFDISSL